MASSSGPSTAATAAATKAEEIAMVLAEPEVNLWKLRELAISEGGLVNDTLRQRAWPKLVGLKGDGTENDSNGSLKHSLSEASLMSMDSKYSAESFAKDGFGVMDPAQLASKVRKTSSTTGGAASTLVVARSDDADQIERDISRCTWHLLSGAQRSRRRQMENKHRKKIATILKRKQRKLGNLINLTLLKSYHQDVTVPGEMGEEDDIKLRYYQGYHDVACIFLNVLGGASTAASSGPLTPSSSSSSLGGQSASFATSELPTTVANLLTMDLAVDVLLQVSKSHLRDAMRCNFQQLTNALRLITMPLIGAFDAEVHSHLYYADMEPFFCLSWVITWFSHDVRNTTLVKRLFDVFCASHPLMPIYVSVAMVLHPYNRQEILQSDCDFAVVHNLLSSLPRNSCSIGWKFMGSGEGGYVSTDEDEQDEDDQQQQQQQEKKDFDDTASLDKSLLSEDFSLKRAASTEVDTDPPGIANAGSTDEGVLDPATSYKVATTGNVPFEDLITTAITFMRRIPPRKLAALARKYHTDPLVTPLLGETSSIALLQPPPTWGLASKIPSDWTLKQQARERRGVGGQRRKRRSSSQSQLASTDDKNGIPEQQQVVPKQAVRELDLNSRAAKNNFAVIASGMGPDGEEEERQRRRLKMILWGGVAVALLSVTVAVVMHSGLTFPPPTLEFGKDAPPADAPSTLECKDGADKTCTTSTPTFGDDEEEKGKASDEAQGTADKVDEHLSFDDLAEEFSCAEGETCASDDAPSTTEGTQVDSSPPSAVELDSGMLATSAKATTEVEEPRGVEANITLGGDDVSLDESTEESMDSRKEAEAAHLVKPVAFVRLPTKSVESQVDAGKAKETAEAEAASEKDSVPNDRGTQQEETETEDRLGVRDDKDAELVGVPEGDIAEDAEFITVPVSEGDMAEDAESTDVPVSEGDTAEDAESTDVRVTEGDVAGDAESTDVPVTEGDVAEDAEPTDVPVTKDDVAKDAESTDVPVTKGDVAGDAESTDVPVTKGDVADDLTDDDGAPPAEQVDDARAASNVSASDDRIAEDRASHADEIEDFESTKEWSSEDEASTVDVVSSSDRSLDFGSQNDTRLMEEETPAIGAPAEPDVDPKMPTQRQRRVKVWRRVVRGVRGVVNVVRDVVEDANYVHLVPSLSPRNRT